MKPVITLIEPPALGVRVTTKEEEKFALPTIRTHHPKLGIEVLAGALQNLPCEVQVVDMKMLSAKESPYKIFEHDGLKYECSRVGASFEQIREVIEASDVIGISSPFTQAAGIIADLGIFIKQVNPKVRLVVGGYDTLTDDRQGFYLRNGFDHVIPSRGEIGFPRWISSQFNITLPDISPACVLLDDPTRPANRLILPLPDLSKVKYQSYVETEDGKLPDGASLPTEYFVSSRGCDNSCEFCTIWNSNHGDYEAMSVQDVGILLSYYKDHGITTLMHAESNTMTRLKYGNNGRQNLIDTMRMMRSYGFAWEFFDGIEFGRLLDGQGRVDEELVSLLFSPEILGNKLVGGYRAYIPVETVCTEKFGKLPPAHSQNQVFESIIKSGVRQLSFGIILGFPDESHESIERIRKRVDELKALADRVSGGKTKSIFIFYVHSLFPGSIIYRRLHDTLTVDIAKHPEMFQLYTACKRSAEFSPSEITLLRRRLDREFNGDEVADYSERTGRAPVLAPSVLPV